MSSWLQFGGRVTRKGFGLLFHLERPSTPEDKTLYSRVDAETYACKMCGKQHAVLHEAFRKPAGTWGHWVVFRYNGQENVPDLSLPIGVTKLPRGSRRLTDEEASKYWHS